MNTQLSFGVAGKYKLKALKVDKDNNVISERLLADWFDNLITNNGLEQIATKAFGSSTNVACVVGTGNTTPTYADTLLASWLAGTFNITSVWATTPQISTAPYYISSIQKWTFNAGEATVNLTEVGLTMSNSFTSTTPLFSRALILDGSGNPTTITVLSDEILEVTYEFRTYLPNGGSDITGTFNQTIDGVSTSFNYTLRPASISSWDPTKIVFGGRSLGPGLYPGNYNIAGGVTDQPLNTISNFPGPGTLNAAWQSGSSTTYVANSHQSVCTLGLDLNTGNGSWSTLYFTIGAGVTLGWCYYQMSITPSITKINTKIYSFTFTFSWARYP